MNNHVFETPDRINTMVNHCTEKKSLTTDSMLRTRKRKKAQHVQPDRHGVLRCTLPASSVASPLWPAWMSQPGEVARTTRKDWPNRLKALDVRSISCHAQEPGVHRPKWFWKGPTQSTIGRICGLFFKRKHGATNITHHEEFVFGTFNISSEESRRVLSG